MPSLAELAGFDRNPISALGSLVDSLKQQLMQRGSDVASNPGILVDELKQRLAEFAQGQQQNRGSMQSVMPEVRERAMQDSLAQAMNLGGLLGITAYHGSPHTFDKFDASKAGKSGGTSFGLGHNLSADASHAAAYKGDTGNIYTVDIADDSVPKMLSWEKDAPEDLAKSVPILDKSKPIPFGSGATIENDSGQWLLRSGNSAFKLMPQEVSRMFDGNRGEAVYRRLVAAHGGDEAAASEWLRKRGIPGIVNDTERGVRNYTVFPGAEDLLKILGRE